jgi:predicted DNA-binding transcriptional regulator AlpA
MNRVLSYDEAAGRAGFVRRTLERLIAVGDGPAVIELSARRRGILESDLEAWLLGRRRPAPGAAMPPVDAPVKRGRGRPRKVATDAVAA